MSPADIPLATFGTIMAVAQWTALVFLLMASKRANHWLVRFGLMAVTLNGALLWTASAYMRVTGTVDVYLLNGWSRVFYAMFAAYVLGFAVLTWLVARKVDRLNE